MESPVQRARLLRRSATKVQRRLWLALRRNSVDGFYFRRQAPLLEFVVDFVCFEARLVIEVQGAAQEDASDQERVARLRGEKFEVLQVSEQDVFGAIEGVLKTVRGKLLRLPLAVPELPPPLRGRVGEGGLTPAPSSAAQPTGSPSTKP